MSGLINPLKGKIKIDDILLKENEYHGLRYYFSIISQNSNLIADSIKKNIAFGIRDDEIDKEKLIAASKKASIYDFINNLDNGFDSHINEKAFNISGVKNKELR